TRRYIAWHAAQQLGATRRRAPVRERAVGLVRSAGVATVAIAAGALAAVLSRFDQITDPAGPIGMLVLLGIPIARVGRGDRARERRRGVLAGASVRVGVALA